MRNGVVAGGILVVDGDTDVCISLTRSLRSLGYPVRAASLGREALAAARRQRPALVLLEVSLPDISGDEVCHRLRTEFGAEVQILFLSGDRTTENDRAAGLLLGADDYIAKPFDLDDLIARVLRALPLDDRPSTLGSLTEREWDVLKLLAE